MLPRYVAKYRLYFDGSAMKLKLDPLLLAAICDRETLCGLTTTPEGPEGTGDFAPRHDHGDGRFAKNPALFAATKMPDGSLCYLPADGLGWGRGLMQIDLGAHWEWCMQRVSDGRFNWEDAGLNIEKGAEILAGYLVLFGGLLPAGIASYNAGPNRVRGALNAITRPGGGDPPLEAQVAACDSVTTHRDYVSDVMARMARFRAPSTPAPPPPVPPKGSTT